MSTSWKRAYALLAMFVWLAWEGVESNRFNYYEYDAYSERPFWCTQDTRSELKNFNTYLKVPNMRGDFQESMAGRAIDVTGGRGIHPGVRVLWHEHPQSGWGAW